MVVLVDQRCNHKLSATLESNFCYTVTHILFLYLLQIEIRQRQATESVYEDKLLMKNIMNNSWD